MYILFQNVPELNTVKTAQKRVLVILSTRKAATKRTVPVRAYRGRKGLDVTQTLRNANRTRAVNIVYVSRNRDPFNASVRMDISGQRTSVKVSL